MNRGKRIDPLGDIESPENVAWLERELIAVAEEADAVEAQEMSRRLYNFAVLTYETAAKIIETEKTQPAYLPGFPRITPIADEEAVSEASRAKLRAFRSGRRKTFIAGPRGIAVI